MGVSICRRKKRRGPSPSDREYLARLCSRCGLRATHEPLYAVAEDILCGWCRYQWWRLFNGEDEYGRLLHGPGTRFLKQQDTV